MSYGYPQPLSQLQGAAPRYSFAKPRNGPRSHRGKLHLDHVQEMRRWAQRDGFGLSQGQQIQLLKQRYPSLAESTIEQVLNNNSWHDPSYDRETPDPEWATLPVAVVLLLVMRRMYTLV